MGYAFPDSYWQNYEANTSSNVKALHWNYFLFPDILFKFTFNLFLLATEMSCKNNVSFDHCLVILPPRWTCVKSDKLETTVCDQPEHREADQNHQKEQQGDKEGTYPCYAKLKVNMQLSCLCKKNEHYFASYTESMHEWNTK